MYAVRRKVKHFKVLIENCLVLRQQTKPENVILLRSETFQVEVTT